MLYAIMDAAQFQAVEAIASIAAYVMWVGQFNYIEHVNYRFIYNLSNNVAL